MRQLQVTIVLALALPAAAGLAACRHEAADDRAEIRENLQEKGPSAVVAEAARTADFEPPADGRLSEDQVKMYLDVRRREKQILSVAAQDLEARNVPGSAGAGQGSGGAGQGAGQGEGGRAPAGQGQGQAAGASGTGSQAGTKVTVGEVTAPPRDVAQIATADVRAAQELGKDPLEYQWVKGQILQAQMALYTNDWAQLEESGREKMIESLHRMEDVAATPAEKGEIERKIDELRNPQATAREVSEGLRHNMQLVRDHQREILALERWPEMAGSPAAAPAGAGGSGRAAGSPGR